MKSQPTPDDFLSSFLALCGRLKEVRGQRYEHLPFQSEFATTTVNNSFLLENDPISINEASRPLSIFFKYSLDPQIHAAFSLNNSAKWHQRVHERLAALVLSLEISGKRNVADELQDLLAKLYLFAEFAEQMATGSLLADEYLRILWVLLRCADLLDSHTPMQGLRLHIDGSDTIPSEISLSSDVLSSQSGISVASDHVSDNPSAAFRRPFSSSTPFAVSLSVGNIKSDHEVPNVIAYDAQPGTQLLFLCNYHRPVGPFGFL
ncbi:hypothetical protein DFS34DRAFT_22443 [Phlyctochytrium arcticum]|nr:hypothetical protein DFS34DRAFT_22443 [Phlyctochytrium arcticum]